MQRSGRTKAWCWWRNLNRGRHFSAGAALAPARRIAGSYSIIRRCKSAPLFRPERQQDVVADAGDVAELELTPFVEAGPGQFLPAEDFRRDEESQLVPQASSEELAVDVGAAFDEHAGEAAPGEI